MILLFGHPACAGCESAYSDERSGLADHGTNQATLDVKTSGYGLWVRNIQKSRTASLRAAATFAMARCFWWQRCSLTGGKNGKQGLLFSRLLPRIQTSIESIRFGTQYALLRPY